MPGTTRLITEIHHIRDQGLCSLCGKDTPSWAYTTRSGVRRQTRDDGTIVDAWDEGRWEVCRVCSVLVDRRETHNLMARVSACREGRAFTKRNIRVVSRFFDELQPGRAAVTGVGCGSLNPRPYPE